MANLISVLFSMGVALSAFGALYQPIFLGYLAASPGILILGSTLIFLPLCKTRKQCRRVLLLLAWGGIGSLISLIIYGFSEKYFAKMMPLFVLNLVWISPLLWGNKIKLQHLRRGLFGGLAICLLGFLATDLIHFDFVLKLAFTEGYQTVEDGRARGFMQETSHFAHYIGHALILLYLMSSVQKPAKNRDVVVFLVLLSVFLGIIASRGSAISALVALLLATINRRNIYYLLLISPVIYLLGANVLYSITYDINNFTSTATRSTLWLASINALIHNPLGYGYYGFYGAVQEFGREAIRIVGGQTTFITTELIDIVEGLNNVSTKSTLFDFGLIFGLSFYIMIWWIVKHINISDVRARAALAYFFLSTLTTSGHQSLFFFLGLSVLLRLYPRKLEANHLPKTFSQL